MIAGVGEALANALGGLLEAMVTLIVGTPAPNRIFGEPTNEPWATAYTYFHGDVMVLAMLLFAAAIAAITLAGTVGDVFTPYQTSQLWWRAILGLCFIFFWWPTAAIALNFADALALFIAPSSEAFTESLVGVFAGITGAAVVAGTMHIAATGFVIAIAMVYGARWVALLALTVFMVVFVMLWIVNASLFSRVSDLAAGLMSLFVPLLFMTLPTAILMRLGLIVFEAGASSIGLSSGVMVFLALGILLASLVAPKFVFDIANRFMAHSYGSDKIGNKIDEAGGYARQRAGDKYREWRGGGPASGSGGGASGGGGGGGPTPTLTASPIGGTGGTSGTGNAHWVDDPSRIRGQDGGRRALATDTTPTDTAATGGRSTGLVSPSTPATTSTPTSEPQSTPTIENGSSFEPTSNKYASESTGDEYRVSARQRELTKTYQTYAYDHEYNTFGKNSTKRR